MTQQIPTSAEVKNQGSSANIIYILYLVGLVVGVTALIGVIMAYMNRDDAPAWVRSHYEFQIRTFWIGLAMVVVGGITSFIAVGFLLLLFYTVWLIIRCVKGMQYVSRGESHPDPDTWMFG